MPTEDIVLSASACCNGLLFWLSPGQSGQLTDRPRPRRNSVRLAPRPGALRALPSDTAAGGDLALDGRTFGHRWQHPSQGEEDHHQKDGRGAVEHGLANRLRRIELDGLLPIFQGHTRIDQAAQQGQGGRGNQRARYYSTLAHNLTSLRIWRR